MKSTQIPKYVHNKDGHDYCRDCPHFYNSYDCSSCIPPDNGDNEMELTQDLIKQNERGEYIDCINFQMCWSLKCINECGKDFDKGECNGCKETLNCYGCEDYYSL